MNDTTTKALEAARVVGALVLAFFAFKAIQRKEYLQGVIFALVALWLWRGGLGLPALGGWGSGAGGFLGSSSAIADTSQTQTPNGTSGGGGVKVTVPLAVVGSDVVFPNGMHTSPAAAASIIATTYPPGGVVVDATNTRQGLVEAAYTLLAHLQARGIPYVSNLPAIGNMQDFLDTAAAPPG